jgi:two-component system response regulator
MSNSVAQILLVEDSPDDAELFVRMFTKSNVNARVEVVPDGKEALDFIYCTGNYAHRNPAVRPKVIVLDLKLPKVDGLEVLRRLKRDPRMRSIPVVILSSSHEERDLVESHAIGVNSYLVKPMDFDELAVTVRSLCQYWLQLNQTPKF